jgi:hypothetical protein
MIRYLVELLKEIISSSYEDDIIIYNDDEITYNELD